MAFSEQAGAIPPIRRSVLVRSDRAHVFEVFVGELGQWWPTMSHSLGGDRLAKVTVERHEGGRVYETWDDGTECVWGEVLLWEPPERYAMTWESTRYDHGADDLKLSPEGAATEVELRFLELGPALTRVELEHRGWERLSPALAARYPSSYSSGWASILDRLVAYAEDPQNELPGV
ncbi:SRPBCC family protein [Streptosporangiaceae bacterium NEAU-GS5]|nr:SRPBCC family protein [Streptosporangiaceae bacterium NEAU-GS5]